MVHQAWHSIEEWVFSASYRRGLWYFGSHSLGIVPFQSSIVDSSLPLEFGSDKLFKGSISRLSTWHLLLKG